MAICSIAALMILTVGGTPVELDELKDQMVWMKKELLEAKSQVQLVQTELAQVKAQLAQSDLDKRTVVQQPRESASARNMHRRRAAHEECAACKPCCGQFGEGKCKDCAACSQWEAEICSSSESSGSSGSCFDADPATVLATAKENSIPNVNTCADVVANQLCPHVAQLCCASCPKVAPNKGTSIPQGVNEAVGQGSIAIGFQAKAVEGMAIAIGFQVEAQSASSLATGMFSKAEIDKTTPTKHSAGAATAMGFATRAIGDYSMSMNSNTVARGYCASAMGEGTEANAFGELAAGLYTETEGMPYTNAYPVIPSSSDNKSYPWPEGAQYGSATSSQILLNKNDAVLRIGIGECEEYATNPSTPYASCKKAKRMDGMRLHRDGRLYLRKRDGSKIDDVQATIEDLQARVKAVEVARKRVVESSTSPATRLATPSQIFVAGSSMLALCLRHWHM